MAGKKVKEDVNAAAKDKAMAEIAAAADGQYEQITSGKNYKWDTGAQLIGKLINLPYKAGLSFAFDMEVDAGDGETEVITAWCPTILGNLLKKVKVGDNIVIRCIGTISTQNGDAYDFVLARKTGR